MSDAAIRLSMVDGPRALLTDRERDAVRGDPDVDDDTRRTLLSRVRKKLKNLADDVELLRQHHPEIADVVDEAVSPEAQGPESGDADAPPAVETEGDAEPDDPDSDVDELRRLEQELTELRERVDEHDRLLSENTERENDGTSDDDAEADR